MTRTRQIATLFVVVGLIFSTQGMVGLSLLDTDRSATITTAGDNDAYVGYEPTEPDNLTVDDNVTVLFIENRHTDNITVS